MTIRRLDCLLNSDKNILLVRVRRDKKGLKIYLKSSCLEDYFNQIAGGVINHRTWGGLRAYQGNDPRLSSKHSEVLHENNWQGSSNLPEMK